MPDSVTVIVDVLDVLDVDVMMPPFKACQLNVTPGVVDVPVTVVGGVLISIFNGSSGPAFTFGGSQNRKGS